MGKIADPMARRGRKPTKKKARPETRDRPESETRRTLRRRRQYYSDFYGDDSVEEGDEKREERRKEKKLKLVLKLPSSQAHHVSATPDSSDCENGDKAPIKKRRIGACNDCDDSDVEAGDEDCVRSVASGDEMEGEKGGAQEAGFAGAVVLPDRTALELILDKLQKKDTYGVYAEPVDPEELPDYHEVIASPMDFGTIRKKLASGSYSTLEQFEGDVFLVCTNAMQYNAPETIYFKQARSIQELARKRFEKLRVEELNSAEKPRSNSVTDTPTKKPLSGTVQDHVGSDFSSGATLATAGDACTLSVATQAGDSVEKLEIVDSLRDGNSFLAENKGEKIDELSAKGFPFKLGRKPSVLDENRRATYDLSNQLVARVDSVFSTFEDEEKQLIAVGLQADHSYARSLARFAAVLGPTAWKVASKRIKEALPAGYKFGRGWVGEYEPLPTPALTLENNSRRRPAYGSKQYRGTEPEKGDEAEKSNATKNSGAKNVQLDLRNHLNSSTKAASSVVSIPSKEGSLKAVTLEAKPGFLGVNAVHQQQKYPLAMEPGKSETYVLKQVEVNRPSLPSSTPIEVPSVRAEYSSEEPTSRTSRLFEMVQRNRNFTGFPPFKQPELKLHPNHRTSQTGPNSVEFPNGNGASNPHNNKAARLSLNSALSNQEGHPSFLPPTNHGQGLDDPVKMLKMLRGNMAQGTPALKSSYSSMTVDSQIMSTVPLSRRDDSSASAASANAWMTIGPASPYNPTREPPYSEGVKAQNIFAPQPISQAANIGGEDPRFRNIRSTVFPQHLGPGLSRFHMQTPWQGFIPTTQQVQKKDTLPPDLNIGFQPPGSPVRPSSGIRVDSQQPDLALQL